MVGLTRAMALELAPHAIRVNAIAPGLTDTAQPRDGHSEIELQAMARQVPLGRMGQPDDVAAVAVFLASADARSTSPGRSSTSTAERIWDDGGPRATFGAPRQSRETRLS